MPLGIHMRVQIQEIVFVFSQTDCLMNSMLLDCCGLGYCLSFTDCLVNS